MAKKTTQKAVKSADKKQKTDFKNVWKNIKLGFYTGLTTTKILAFGGLGSYLVTTGISKSDVVYMAFGSILAGYAIVVLVSITHVATKSTKA